ncbi:hypothetical protein [Stenotrophomonas sp. JAG2]|uniref:hypothetical protein n=1 Tax=Stenotrophomonas sp. JAG2 TaxID=3229243 RepID=UPI0034E24428
MPLSFFCPQAAQWGVVADYINGAIALGVGVAVYRLGTKTQDTSDQVASMERKARGREDALHQREGEGILLYTYPDILLAERSLQDIRNKLTGVIFEAVYKGDRAFRERIAKQADEIEVPLLAEVIHRVHVLDDDAAGNALMLLGGLRGLKYTSHLAGQISDGDLRIDECFKTIVETLDQLINCGNMLQSLGDAVMERLSASKSLA